MPDQPARPRQVTLSGVLILAGSIFLVLLSFQQVAALGSLESQEAARRLISEPPADGLGLSVSDVQTTLRVLGLVGGACGAAAAILGLMVLRRRVATDRLALALLAPVLVISGLAAGGLAVIVVAAAIAFLWSTPARAWYEGREPPPDRVQHPPAAPATPTSPAGPAPVAGSAEPGSVATTARPDIGEVPDVRGPRPAPVLAACIVTWVTCGLTLLLSVASVLVFAAAPDALFDQIHDQNPDLADQGITDRALRVTVYVVAGVIVPWCLAAIVFAIYVLRGARWGAVALLISAGLAGLACAVTVLGSAVMLVPMSACLGTAWLLSRPVSRLWLAARTDG